MSNAADAPVYTVTYIEVAPVAAVEVAKGLRQQLQGARKADGVLRLDVLRRVGPSHHFAIVGAWRSRQQFDSEREGGNGKVLRDKLGPHLIAGVDTRIHGALIGGADTARGTATTWVVTHVDVPPPNKDACIALLEAHVKASRAEPGSVCLDVFQQADRPNHFSVVEGWASQAAYDAHIVASHTRAFRQQLTPLSGALYDERLYRQEG